MFKKVIIFLLVISPILFFILIGFPVNEVKKESQSRRCFKVSEFNQLISCYKTHPRLAGYHLFNRLNQELNLLHPGFNYLFLILLAGNIIITPKAIELILKKRRNNVKK